MRTSATFRSNPPRDIVLVMLSAIGDAVHVLPVANALKRQWPETRITWIIQSLPHQMVHGHPAIDDFIVFNRRRGLRGWESFRELTERLPQQPFDLLLGLQVYFKAGIITALTPANVKLGFDRRRARDLNWLFTTERITATGQHHVQDQYFEFLAHLGVDPHPARWDLPITDEGRDAQRRFYAELDRPACAVVVGTSKTAKNWSAEGYARVLDVVEHTHGLRPILVGGPSPTEREIADQILALTKSRPLDCLGNPLRDLVWLIDGAALTISPDTGPLHISRALDVPVVGLYGYTNPKRTGPYLRFQDLVVDGYAKFPGEAYPVTPAYRDGMKRVTVDAVLEKVELAMARYGPS